MEWHEILGIVLTGVASILAALSPILIQYLKNLKIVKQAHLEALVDSLVPQVIEWVEYWAEQAGGKTSTEKLEKAKEFLFKKIPYLKDHEDIVLRIETALRKGLNKEKANGGAKPKTE